MQRGFFVAVALEKPLVFVAVPLEKPSVLVAVPLEKPSVFLAVRASHYQTLICQN